MKNILFLSHRIPYPPNKGDKIRSYHFLKGLAQNFQIHLATFIDDPKDWEYINKVNKITTRSLFINLNPVISKIKSLCGLLTGKALSLPYYHNKQIQNWVDQTIQENDIDKIFIFSSVMAQYVQKYKELDIIVDFVDVDSDKWLLYSKKATWPMNWVYRREAKRLLAFDSKVARETKMSLFVSEAESRLFQSLVSVDKNKITYVNNGVDVDYFSNYLPYKNPYSNENIIVFTGAMDYWANVDAVIWFVNKVFPKIKQQCKNAEFYIVGSNPAKDVLNLAKVDGVVVTGRVEDIRPYLFYGSVVVAPLLIARGIQNKVLEAMAMGKKIVATPQAIEGIKITKQAVVVTDNAEIFADNVVSYLAAKNEPYFMAENRDFVINNFSWDGSLKRLTGFLQD